MITVLSGMLLEIENFCYEKWPKFYLLLIKFSETRTLPTLVENYQRIVEQEFAQTNPYIWM